MKTVDIINLEFIYTGLIKTACIPECSNYMVEFRKILNSFKQIQAGDKVRLIEYDEATKIFKVHGWAAADLYKNRNDIETHFGYPVHAVDYTSNKATIYSIKHHYITVPIEILERIEPEHVEEIQDIKIEVMKAVPYQVCPKCNGKPWTEVINHLNQYSMCSVCKGEGIIPMYVPEK